MTPEQRAALAAPFANVQWRVAKKAKDKPTRGEVVCYIDARDVMERLDDVFGDDGWSFDWQPIANGKDSDGEYLRLAKGTITIGSISRSDIGEAGNYEKSKAAVSDALKRAAVHFGIARYLYEMPSQWADLDNFGNITKESQAKLDQTLQAQVKRIFGTQTQTTQATHKDTEAKKPTLDELKAEMKRLYEQRGLTLKTMTDFFNQHQMNSRTYGHVEKVVKMLKDDHQAALLHLQQFGATLGLVTPGAVMGIMSRLTRRPDLIPYDAWVMISQNEGDWKQDIANELAAAKAAS